MATKPLIVIESPTQVKIRKKTKREPPMATRWKKGQSGNPKGINISPEKRALKELTERSFAECIKKVLTCTEDELDALMEDRATPAGHKVIIKAVQHAINSGNYNQLDVILERAIGKVVYKVDMTTGGAPIGQALEDKSKIKKALKEIEDEI